MRNSDSKTCTVLTIAGSDSIGGAGIQADLKTISAFGLYGMSVVTAVTAQNTQGVQAVYPMPPNMVEAQLHSIFTDIMPDCVKIGMLVNEEITDIVAETLMKYKPRFIVLDPVMISSSGTELLNEKGRHIMVEKLFPMVTVLTPNLPETRALVDMSKEKLNKEKMNREKDSLEEMADRKQMAEMIRLLFGDEMDREHAILIKGGHSESETSDDYLYCFHQCSSQEFHSTVNLEKAAAEREVMEFFFDSPRIHNKNTHGTGCTLASAVACGLAKGRTVETSVRDAKTYMNGAIYHGLAIGKGVGPLNHFWKMPMYL